MTEDAEAYLDPQIALVLREMAAQELPDRTTLPIAEARAQMAAANQAWNHPLPPLAEMVNLDIEGPALLLPARLMRPTLDAGLPAIVYLHGGGFALGSIDTHQRLMALLAIETGAAVLGVDYRLAPEAPFPAGLEDCLAAIRWLRREAARYQLDPEQILLAGDSAGANLALACLLRLRDGGEPLPIGAGLFYGCYWARLGTESHQRYGRGGYRLTSQEMGWFWSQYLGRHGKSDPFAEPLYADLRGLPPLFLNYGTVDPLADDTIELARRLDAAGVVHECRVYPGLVHGFLQMTSRCDAALLALQDAGAALRAMVPPPC
jgi:acetyl esterase